MITRGSVDGIADALVDGACEFVGFVALGATMMLDAGVKAVLVSVPVGLIVVGTLVVGTTGVGVEMASVVLSLTTGGGVKVGVAVGGGDGLPVSETVWETVPLPVSVGGETVWETVPLPVSVGGETVCEAVTACSINWW